MRDSRPSLRLYLITSLLLVGGAVGAAVVGSYSVELRAGWQLRALRRAATPEERQARAAKLVALGERTRGGYVLRAAAEAAVEEARLAGRKSPLRDPAERERHRELAAALEEAVVAILKPREVKEGEAQAAPPPDYWKRYLLSGPYRWPSWEETVFMARSADALAHQPPAVARALARRWMRRGGSFNVSGAEAGAAFAEHPGGRGRAALLEFFADDAEPMVREAAAWALARLRHAPAAEAFARALEPEVEPELGVRIAAAWGARWLNAPTAVPVPLPPWVARMRALLQDRRISLSLQNATFSSVVEQLRLAAPEITFVLHPDAAAKPVSFSVQNMSLEQIVRWITVAGDLAYVLRDGTLVIATKKNLEATGEVRLYDVRDFMPWPVFSTGDPRPWEPSAFEVEHAFYKYLGCETIERFEYRDGRLIVWTSPEMQDWVERRLADFRASFEAVWAQLSEPTGTEGAEIERAWCHAVISALRELNAPAPPPASATPAVPSAPPATR